MKRILLAVITEDDQCVAPFCSSLVETVKVGLGKDIEFFPVFLPGDGNWSMAFNRLATFSWNEKIDGFVCINPRVSWKPESLIDLVNTEKDAVALPVATRGGFEIQLGEIARLQDDGSHIKVQNASLDLFYLSAYALGRLCESHPLIKHRGAEVKLILQSGDIYGAYFDPADILAYRLREQGIEVEVCYKHTAHRSDYIHYASDFEKTLTELKEQ